MRRTLLVLMTLAPAAFGQRTLQLSMKRAVEIALAPEGSTRVALAEESLSQSTEKVRQARNAFLPTLDGSVQDRNQTVNLRTFGFDFNLFSFPGISFPFPTIVGPFQVFDARASAQGPVLDFGIIRRLRAARSGEDVAKSDLDAARNQTSDRVARAYLGSLRAEAALDTAHANVDLADALVKLADSQRRAGSGTGIEVTRAQVQLANERLQLVTAENDRRKSILELLRAMGLDLDTDIAFTDKLDYQPVDVGAAEAELAKARAERAELKGQQQREQTARLNYDATRAESLLSVVAFGDFGTIGSSLPQAKATHTVGVTVKVPLFDARRNGRREDSYLQYRAEKIRTKDLQQQVELEVRLALDALRTAQTQVETSREAATLAQNELDQARRRYQAGVTNSIEVTDAQTRLDRARDSQIAAMYNYSLARIDLATATGRITEYVNQ